VVAMRVHLDDSVESNGPLRIVPATHRLGVLSDSEISSNVDHRLTRSLTAATGDVIAMRPLVIHSSQKAESNAPRRVLHIEYSSARAFDGMRLAITG
jgi:ectoine hydroxylase-related dioxygenase (phytanoyl-CoA dioxygenase family)